MHRVGQSLGGQDAEAEGGAGGAEVAARPLRSRDSPPEAVYLLLCFGCFILQANHLQRLFLP